MTVLRLQDMDLKNKRVLMRVDFNVPVKNGKVMSDARILASIPTIQHALEAGAKVMLMSHLGRPKEGQFDAASSLQPVADRLSQLLAKPVPLIKDWLNGVEIKSGEVVLFENVRFNVGEEANDDGLAKKMAALCDVFVMDAFGSAHRAHASTHGVAKYAPVACAGLLLQGELDALARVLDHPKRPLVAIVGGSKVSTKLTILKSLIDKVDQLIVGGGIANTFLAATGMPVGSSLYEPDLVDEAKSIMQSLTAEGGYIPLPTDVVVAKEFAESAVGKTKTVREVSKDEMILDIGPESAAKLSKLIQEAGTILWNGPLGVFEFPAFAAGTQAIAESIAKSSAFSVAGGGDTLSAIEQFQVDDKISYISTGGGAFLEFLEGKKLPAVAILEERASKTTSH